MRPCHGREAQIDDTSLRANKIGAICAARYRALPIGSVGCTLEACAARFNCMPRDFVPFSVWCLLVVLPFRPAQVPQLCRCNMYRIPRIDYARGLVSQKEMLLFHGRDLLSKHKEKKSRTLRTRNRKTKKTNLPKGEGKAGYSLPTIPRWRSIDGFSCLTCAQNSSP